MNEIDLAHRGIEDRNKFLGVLLDAIEHQMYVIDAKTFEVSYANKSAVPSGLIKGSKCYELTHLLKEPCVGTERVCPIDIIVNTKEPCRIEHIHFDSKGEPVYVEIYATPVFDNKGEVIQIIEAILDVTERKQAEEKKSKSEVAAAELAGILKTNVTYAHEINNPLTGIIGYAELLLEPTVSDSEKQDMINNIISAADRIAKVIETMQNLRTPAFVDYSGNQEMIDIEK